MSTEPTYEDLEAEYERIFNRNVELRKENKRLLTEDSNRKAVIDAAQAVYESAEEVASYGDGMQAFEVPADEFHGLQEALAAVSGNQGGQ